MKNILPIQVNGSPTKRLQDRLGARIQVQAQGTPKPPSRPRDVAITASANAVALKWAAPANPKNIVGWRVYRGSESNLVAEIHDRLTRQFALPITEKSKDNYFVSAITGIAESLKSSVQGEAGGTSTGDSASAGVSSVGGRTGDVSLTEADIENLVADLAALRAAAKSAITVNNVNAGYDYFIMANLYPVIGLGADPTSSLRITVNV